VRFKVSDVAHSAPVAQERARPLKERLDAPLSYALRCDGFTWRTRVQWRGHCPWCGVDCGPDPAALMHHLNLVHDRLFSTYRSDGACPEVSVSVCEEFTDTTDPAVDPNPRSRAAGTPEGFQWVKQNGGWSLADGLDATRDRGQHALLHSAPHGATAETRQYYHITSRAVMNANPDSDSEDDEDIELTTHKIEAALDDFDDVNGSEKTLMKVWNRHLLKYPVLADSHSRALCEVFIDEHTAELQALRNNFMLHLSTMTRCGALQPEEMVGVIDYFYAASVNLP